MIADRTLGLVVNPVAGLGGPLAEKGSDRPDVARRAAVAGLSARSPERARRAMAAFAAAGGRHVIAGPGALGADAAPGAALADDAAPTGTAVDTTRLVEGMQGRVGLIVFCGGDGTARDVAAANRMGHPLLGVPAGVKMHSGVFARSPERAGAVAAAFLAASHRRTELVEILDIDEAARRGGRLSARIHAVARTPVATGARQGAKAAGGDVLAEVDAALGAYARGMARDTAYLLGPGTTMGALKDRLGGGTLLGVDVARAGAIVALDADEPTLLALLGAAGPARIVLTVIGGQGFVLGRGNQQISAAVIRRVGAAGIDVICSAAKLAALDPPELTVDTGDPALDAALTGYWPVITGPGRRQVVRVVP